MENKKPRKVNFTIQHCSSEDNDYPVTQLLLQSADARGWQSKRFAPFPQTIIIQLVQSVFLAKVAILSHQSKISSKIELEVKLEENEEWKKLGRVSLDSNVNTNFQARELKQANLNNSSAKFIKLIFRNNHVNNQNIFNQVGLISISFYGDQINENQKPAFIPPSRSQIDNNTLAKIKELEVKKKKAVENQDFDQAKQIKEEIDRIKNIAATLAILEENKQEAIRKQNFQDAKIINEKIKKLRQNSTINQGSNTAMNRVDVNQKPVQQDFKKGSQEEYQAVSPITHTNPKPVSKKIEPIPMQEKKPEQKIPSRNAPPQNNYGDDDRPIHVKNTNPYQESAEQNEEDIKKDIELEPLNKEILDECSQYLSVFNEEIFQCIFSRDHSHRERGIAMIQDQLKVTRNREDFIGASLFVVKNLIDDKIASVLIAAISMMNEMMRKLKPQASSYNQSLVEYILEKMSDCLGHNNQKIRTISEDTFANFPIYPLTNKEVCYRALAQVGKREKPPKILAGRLKMINRIVKEYQLGKDYQEVIKYAVKYADDKNNDVRTAAINVICSMSLQIGQQSMQGYLKGLRPAIVKSIEEKLDELGGGEETPNLDERPIKVKANNEKPITKSKPNQEFQSIGNQFIDLPKKSRPTTTLNQDFLCEFCGRMDKRFAEEDYKDLHFFNACPMLTICNECNQGVEISTLNSHLVGECGNSKYFKKCPRCKEAVHQKIYKSHVEKKECLSAKPMAVANRCPLCHLDINPGVNGWKDHLVEEGCENNPRA